MLNYGKLVIKSNELTFHSMGLASCEKANSFTFEKFLDDYPKIQTRLRTAHLGAWLLI